MRFLKRLSAVLVCLLLGQQMVTGGCTNPNTKPFRGTFKVGLVAPFSGPDSFVGYNMLFAAKLAIKEWNESDRLNGYRVELLAQDDRNEAAASLIQAKKMVVDSDVVGVIGHPSNASAMAAAEVYSSAGLALIDTEATADALSSGLYQGVFRLSASDSEVLTETLKYVKGTLKTSKLAVVAAPVLRDIKYSEQFYSLMRAEGLTLAFGEPLKPEQTDFSDISRRMAATSPQAIVFTGGYLNAAVLLGQMRQQKMSGAYLVNMGSLNPLFLKVAGNSAEGAYLVASAPTPTDIPEAAGFVQAYRALAGQDPLPSAVLTYDATRLLLSAIERALVDVPQPDRKTVISSLQSVQEFSGLSSKITFDKTGGIADPKVYFYRITGLRFPGERQQ